MKLPVVVAQSEVSGAFPQPQASLAVAGAPGQALAQTGEVLTKTGALYADAQNKLASAEAKTESDTAIQSVTRDLAQRKVEMQEAGIDPYTYEQSIAKHLTELGTQAGLQIRSPQGQQRFMAELRQFATRQIVDAKGEALQLRLGLVQMRGSQQLREDAVTAVTAPMEIDRLKAVQRAHSTVAEFVSKKIWTADQGDTHIRLFNTDVQLGEIDRDVRDPAKAQAVIDRLMRGGYPLAGSLSQQMSKGREIQAQRLRDQREIEATTDKTMKRQADVWVSRAIDSYGTGEIPDRWSREQVREGLKLFEGYVPVETQRALMAMVNKPELEGGTTDPDVFNDLQLRILANPTGFSQNTILREPPERLAATDKAKLLKMVQQAKQEDDVSKSPFYQKGREQIMVLLGGVQTGIPEMLGLPILKPAERDRLSRTLFQFDQAARSAKYRDAPETLTALGRSMAMSALGAEDTPPKPGAAPTTPTAGGPPPITLPKAGESESGAKGSKKAVPR